MTDPETQIPGLPNIPGGYLTSSQAADLVGVQRQTLQSYRNRPGHFPPPEPVKVSGHLFWPRKALAEWQAKRLEMGRGYRHDRSVGDR